MPETTPPPTPPPVETFLAVAKAVATPEVSSQHGFKVDVKEPTAWFDSFLQAQRGESPRRGFTVGKVDLTDDVASDVRSTIKVFGAEKDEAVTFELETKINYTESRIESDGGFTPTGNAVKMAKALRERGMTVKFATSPTGQQVMILERDGVCCGVNLGWSSAVEKPDDKSSDTRNLWKDLASGMFRKEESPNPVPEAPIKRNEPIQLVLTNEKGDGIRIKAKSQIELGRQLEGYAGITGDFVDVYYQSYGGNPKSESMTMQIPDWESYVGDDPGLAGVQMESGDIASEFARRFMGREEEIGILLTPEERATMPSLADIGGQPQAVEEARRLVMSIKYADLYAKRGVDRPRGVLLKGPPGTGKTMLAKAVAREAGAEFISLSVTDLVSKWYGEAEQHVQGFFDRAKALTDQGRDVITFIDEIDSVVPTREGAHEATQRMVAVFLQNMDGLRGNPRLTILAATNQPERIDPAFLRQGRLDKKIEVSMPNVEGRAQILDIHLRKHVDRVGGAADFVAADLDRHAVAESLGDISGADIAGIVNLALEAKVATEIRYLEGLDGGVPWSPLTAEDLLKTKEKYMPPPKERTPMGFVPPKAIT